MLNHNKFKNYLLPLPELDKSENIKIMSFDIETTGKENSFYMGSTYDGENINVFYDKQKMGDFLISRDNRNKLMIATNLMFDLSGLYYPYSEKWDIFMLASKIIFAKYYYYQNKQKKKSDNITFIDTGNFNQYLSVKKMGDIIGLPKGEQPKCFKRKPNNLEEEKELRDYNIRDSMITYKFTKFFIEALNKLGGKFHYTIAGCSMDIFRRKYQKEKLLKPPLDILLKMYDGYFGGRVEVFKFGYSEKPLHYYDINSLYPYVMQNSYPDTNSIRYSDKPKKELIKYEGLSKVKIRAPNLFYPYLPYRKDHKVLYPVGEFEGVYTNFELRQAELLGYEILQMYWTIYYLETENTFKNFVVDLYNQRLKFKEQKSTMEHVVKYLMNSGYGRFGLNINSDKTGILTKWDNDIASLKEGDLLIHDDYLIRSIKDLNKIPNYVNPILSIYTTAYARDILYSYLIKYEPYYCDTDSIVTEKTIDVSKNLGGMKEEYSINKSWFLFPKAYRIIGDTFDVIRWKGIPSIYLIDFWNNNFKTKIEHFTKLKEGIRRDIAVNQIIDMTKELRQIKHKREPEREIDFLTENCITLPPMIS